MLSIESRRGLGRAELDTDALEHELTVHEIELEMQNEELLRIQLDLEEARSRAQVFFTKAPIACVVLDRETRILEANSASAKLLLRSKEELEGMRLADLMQREHATGLRAQLRELSESGTSPSIVVTIDRGIAGRSRVVIDARLAGDAFACWLTPVAADHDLRGEAQVGSDQAEREAELKEALARFELLSSTIEDVFFIVQLSTPRLVYVSPAFERVFGRPAEDALAPECDPIAWVHPEDRGHARRAIAAFLRGDPLDLECRIVQKTSAVRIVRVRGSIADGDRVVGIATDLTDERALEDEVQQAQRMQSIGALASGIAHDFNNMLMGIIGFGTIATERLDADHPARPMIKKIIEVAGRGKALTRQLLDFSRKRHQERTPLDLDSVVAGSAPLIETLVGEHIQVLIRTEAISCRVRADACEIEQVLMNLAANSRDAMPRGGTLLIETKESSIHSSGIADLPRGRYAILTVKDTGCGMDHATMARVFEPFFTTKERGTGLGLANVTSIVRRLGGRLFVSSKLGEGSTFTIILPVEPGTSEIELPNLPDGPAAVLIVEDDPIVRATVAHYVENLGYTPIVAANSAEARRAIREHDGRIDVLLSDVMLPHELGMDLVASIRKELPNVRVVFMSAHDRDDLLKTNRIDGTAPLLHKPFNQRHLALVLHKLLVPTSIQT